MNKTIVVKIGTSAILNAKGDIDAAVVKNLAKGISDLQKMDICIVLVSSGAVGAAQKEFDAGSIGQISKIELAQIRSAVGQPRLMKYFRDAFTSFGIPVAQGLVTRADFADRSRQLSMRNIILKMFRGGILPIVNENDFLTPEELDFSDNDQLAGFFAGMLQADSLIILSDVSGLHSCHPDEPGSEIIHSVSQITDEIEKCVSKKKSKGGLGGMRSKIETAKIMSQLGIEMILANSREENILQKIQSGKNVGTRFLTKHGKKKSGIRVWLAAGASEKGNITLDCPLEKIFREKKSGVSILGVGIKKVSGNFSACDAIGLLSENAEHIGRGAAKISADEMRACLKKGDTKGKVFVHADSLFLL